MAQFRCIECNKLWEFTQPEVHICHCSHEMNVSKEMIKKQTKLEISLGLSGQLGELSKSFVDKIVDEIEELDFFAKEGLDVNGLIEQIWSRLGTAASGMDWRTVVNLKKS